MSHYDDYIDEQYYRNRVATAKNRYEKATAALKYIAESKSQITCGDAYAVELMQQIIKHHKATLYDTAWALNVNS